MSSREFSEWVAYSSKEPLGYIRSDIGFAMVAATVYNMLRSEKSDAKEPSDFLPRYGWPEENAEAEQERLRSKLESAFTMLGGRTLSEGG